VGNGRHPRLTPPHCVAEDPNEFPTRRWSFILGLSGQKFNRIGQDVCERRSHPNPHGVKYSVLGSWVYEGLLGAEQSV